MGNRYEIYVWLCNSNGAYEYVKWWCGESTWKMLYHVYTAKRHSKSKCLKIEWRG